MDLASKDSYIQKLASKVISQRENEPKKKISFVPFKGKSDADLQGKKKKKLKKKNLKENGKEEPLKPQQKPRASPAAQKNLEKTKATLQSLNGATLQIPKEPSFSTVDVLRKRLHEKIEESRGQGAPKDALSEAVMAKRAKRKMERERKKRKRKEFLIKKLAEQSAQEQPAEIKEETIAPASEKRVKAAVIFNKVETVDKAYETSIQAKIKRKKSEKGKITPLTGKNYKQLLSRVEARKEKLEKLREKDETKASEMEKKIKWTNMLYKAEGIKIKDDEDQLRASLKRKEKRREQRKKKWEHRSENVIEKMQQRQDKRKKNLQRRKKAKIEKKKDRARKKGRILPEDLKKAAV
ncbi:PREDICTED: surfeit locus protein 6 [Cyprinodon variegatus]|uniref:surfeit locus protein 6 n=1 Tax=Cyprinodon variegatus TaxID=28743 RepID=UPI0007424F25|nr:PREDICTED: surfeit locus protein 6 [Cyprinodon variegatus]